jgi:hypothetical protein
MFKVFYSWQSDLPPKTNRSLILKTLQKACDGIKKEGGMAVVDRDTQGLSGSPDISDAIFSKIREADAFVADVSIINIEASDSTGFRPTPNPNVLVELGYALATLGNEAIILVVNKHFGEIVDLPFHMRPLRVLSYKASPEDDLATVKKLEKELEGDFKKAIKGIAEVVRADPVYQIIYPQTLKVAGQAEALLQNLIQATRQHFEPKTITRDELNELCRLVDPNWIAPLIIGGNLVQGYEFANWIGFMCDRRDHSRELISNILVFSRFLKRDHIALLVAIEKCSYFALLEFFRNEQNSTQDLTGLASSIWDYLLATRQLEEYAERVLARRAETL